MTSPKKFILALVIVVSVLTGIVMAVRLLALPEPDFVILDSDRDRALTTKEWEDPAFARVDTSRDGAVSAPEFYGYYGRQLRKRQPDLLSFYKAGDLNRDGSLDRLEFPFGDSIFDRLPSPITPQFLARHHPLIDSLVARSLRRPWGWFALRDRNGDGILSATDGAPHRTVLVQDLNRDGAVSMAEVQEQRQGSPRLTLAYIISQLARSFNRLDLDRNGMLDSMELAGRHSLRRFVDVNEDGSLSRQEIFAARDSARSGVDVLQRHMLRVAFVALDRDLDGALTPQELEVARARLELGDVNRDRRLTLNELLAHPAVFDTRATPIRVERRLRREIHGYPLPPQRDSLGRLVSQQRRTTSPPP